MTSRELPSIENGKVSFKREIFVETGKIVLEGDCPHCKKHLIMHEEDVVKAGDNCPRDNCPNCGTSFGVALTLTNEVRDRGIANRQRDAQIQIDDVEDAWLSLKCLGIVLVVVPGVVAVLFWIVGK